MSGPTTPKPGASPAAPATSSTTAAARPGAGSRNVTGGAPRSPISSPLDATTAKQPTIKCPKCGSDVREVARFCQRCHRTMRYECPACKHAQREGGKCEKCGVDFLKYISAVVSSKAEEADAIHDRLEQRSAFMKNLLWLPFTLGIPIIRDYFVKRDRRR